MPFATTNVRSFNLGGGLRVFLGQWTGAVGDAAGTITVQGGQVYLAKFSSMTSTDTYAGDVAGVSWAAGSTTGTVTVNVPNNAAVNGGIFIIVAA